MNKITIRAIDTKTNEIWQGATYLEAIFAFYDIGNIRLEMLKDNEWIPVEIKYAEDK